MKIRIMTLFRDECNYGQRLQAYALLTFLKDLYKDYDIKLYDCRNFCDKKESSDRKKISYFHDFEKKYLDTEIFNIDNIDDVDFFICGSDQVFGWNHVLSNNDRYYYTFEFLKNKNKIITYATSFIPYFCEKYKDIFLKLNELKCISIREQENFKYLDNININVPIIHHIDPCFLIQKEKWIPLSQKPFFVNNNEFNFTYVTYKELLENLDDNMYYCTVKHNKKYNYTSYIGPSEFLWFLLNSKKIYTNSFHGYCLSRILNSEVYNILNLTQKDFRYRNIYNIIYNIYKNDIEELMMYERTKTINYFRKYI